MNKTILEFNNYSWEHTLHNSRIFLYNKEFRQCNFDEKYSELTSMIILPFLRHTLSKGKVYDLILTLNSDDSYYKESILYDKSSDSFLVTIYDEDDIDNEISYPSKFSVRPEKLKAALNNDDTFKTFICLKNINEKLKLDINRFCFKHVSKTLEKDNKYLLSCTDYDYPDFNILSDLFSNVITNYRDYPNLALATVYHSLFGNKDDLFDYIFKTFSEIMQSQGFIKEDECKRFVITPNYKDILNEKIDSVVKNGNLSINNLEKLVFSKIKNYIADKNIADVKINLKECFVENPYINSFWSNRTRPTIVMPLSYTNEHIFYNYYREKIDDIFVDSKRINLNDSNLVHFNVDVSPKVYAPKSNFLIEVKFEFKESNRLMYLKDFKEDITTEELMNLNINIEYIKVYNTKFTNKDI